MGAIPRSELKEFLDEKADQYCTSAFIEDDPIAVPHRYSKREDIEISGFFAATFSWGRRKTILQKTTLLMQLLDEAPHDFVVHAKASDYRIVERFKHRTFNGVDCVFFLKALHHIYTEKGGLENVLTTLKEEHTMENNLNRFHRLFFNLPHQRRTRKHVSCPATGSSCKRLNMFLRWMVRKDPNKVDFGIWKKVKPAQLSIPLDVHSGTVARSLGLLQRKQNDWRAVRTLDEVLREFDPKDPVKYDYALFGLGAIEKFVQT